VASRSGASACAPEEFGPPGHLHAVTVNAADDASGGTLRTCLLATGPGGVCENTVLHFTDPEVPLLHMFLSCLTPAGGLSHARANKPAVLSLISGRRVTPGLVATDVLPFDSAAETMTSAGFKPVYVRDPIAARPAPERTSHMTVIDELLERNANAAAIHEPLPSLPRLNLCIVTCPDPRVDPMAVFGLRPGDAAVVRAAAGRVSPIVAQQLAFLATTGSDYGQRPAGTELLLMTHTNCGIVNFMRDDRRDALAGLLGCSAGELDSRAVTDPREAVRRDIAMLAASPLLPGELSVTGAVYDVRTGRTEVIERRSPLRPASTY